MDKRAFLKQTAALGLGALPFLQQLDQWVAEAAGRPAKELAGDEDFWARIRSGYRLKPDYINLENGYYCFMPQETLDHFLYHVRHINYEGSYYLRTVQFDNKNAVRGRLADMAGCSPEELIITRNTTESLDMIIGGMHWKEGEEAVMASQDYGAMLDMFELQAQRHGIVNKVVSVPNHPHSDSEIVELYANAISPRTRLLMVCHIININGQVLPVRKICDMAHERGVEVMVDGAHSFAHLDFKIPDLGCDYFGASLHKWLSAPLGAGILYVQKEKIPGVWPLLAEMGREPDDILRLNHTGTHPVHTDLAINNALDYHQRIGTERKEARLRYLQQYWTNQVRDWPHIRLNTPAEPERGCAIANVGVEGLTPGELSKVLMDKYRIWTVAINHPTVKGVRITPNVYTSAAELDELVGALKELGR